MSESDEALLERAGRGDDDAMTAMLQRYGPQVRGRINGRIGERYRSAFDEDDVMQVTYLEAFLRTGGFTARGVDAFVAWLTRIAENNLRDAVKELKRSKRPPRDKKLTGVGDASYASLLENLGGSITTASKHAQKNEARILLEACLGRLPPDYAKVILLHELEGQSAPEVAKTIGRSVGAVFMLRARALARLRELLPSESKILGESS